MFVLIVVMTDNFRPQLERPPVSSTGFQHANPNNIPVPPSKSGSFSNFTLYIFLVLNRLVPFEFHMLRTVFMHQVHFSFTRIRCSSDVPL
jgi:hypothetical protein